MLSRLKKIRIQFARFIYREGSTHTRFIARDIKRTIKVISNDRISEGLLTVQHKTSNVLYQMASLSDKPEYSDPIELKLSDLWKWTGASWGGLEDGTSIVGTHELKNDQLSHVIRISYAEQFVPYNLLQSAVVNHFMKIITLNSSHRQPSLQEVYALWRYAEIMEDLPQNPLIRRAYIFTPTLEMKATFVSLGKEDLYEYVIEEPFVAVTERLQYDTEIEGWRSQIKLECKKAFVAYLEDLYADQICEVLGDDCIEVDKIDKWWLMVEAEVGEVKNTWKRSTNTQN